MSELRRDWEKVVAVGLLTQRDLDLLGAGFRRAIPLSARDDFSDLITAIDEADRKAAERGERAVRED